jgi:hypothetical protein
LHAPSVPQLVDPASAHWFSGSWPAATAVHTPLLPVSAHDVQLPVHGPAQHTPCWHEPLAHSPAVTQSAPFTFLPQMVPLQTLPVAHSLLVAHDVAHWPPAPHRYGSHACCVPAAHFPAPSQRPASVAVVPEQVGAMQTVPDSYGRQLPLPSQNPSVPQVEAPLSAHWPSGSCPDGTSVQVPALPGTAHDLHVPLHVVAQHAPCWQMPLLQSSGPAHAPPSGRLPQLPLLQEFGDVQSASAVQAGRHLPSPPHT